MSLYFQLDDNDAFSLHFYEMRGEKEKRKGIARKSLCRNEVTIEEVSDG